MAALQDDLRVLLDEWRRLSAKLESARSNPVNPPPLVHHEGFTLQEREAYIEANRNAGLYRSHILALEETIQSLTESLAMMSDGLTPDEIETLFTPQEAVS